MTLDIKAPGNQWSQLSLAQQFALAAGLVMTLAAVIVGFWVSGRIEEVVVRNTANETALYMESFITPLAQDLATSDQLSKESFDAMENLLNQTELGKRVVAFKIWGRGRQIGRAHV